MYSKTKTPTKSQQIVCLISVLFIFSHCHQTVNIFQNLRDYESIDRILTVYVANKNGCVLCAAIVGASTLTDEFLICFGSSGFVSFCKYLQLNLKKKKSGGGMAEGGGHTCSICKFSKSDVLTFGDWKRLKNLDVHYFCLVSTCDEEK